ncbi:MAG: HNH endonuclease signature motif containing protein [Proteobacteria bacterium]|nr:HNH endonuclease signature motif containing protein [Pseudomonadota bacterium]
MKNTKQQRLKRTMRDPQRISQGDGGYFIDAQAKEKHIKAEKKKAYLIRKSRKWRSKIMREKKCFYCAKTLTVPEATMDHIVPLSRGGRSTMGNLAVSCHDCNKVKKQQTPVEWTIF